MKLVSPDELSDEQRARLGSYRPWLPAGAVCVNVGLGPEPWDVRPLVLDGAKVTLYRFSRSLPEALCKSLGAELEGFSVLSSCQVIVKRRPGSGQFAVARPYHAATVQELLERGEIRPGEHNLGLVKEMISLVKEMRSSRLVHGHLCPSNLALVDGRFHLLDPLIATVNGSESATMPPEAEPGHEVQPASDIFGLAHVVSSLLGESALGSQQQMLKRMLLPSPKQRPTLEEVEAVFAGAASTGAGPSASGKVLRRQEPGAAEKPAEAVSPRPEQSSFWRAARAFVACGAIVAGSGFVLREQYPSAYFKIAGRVPLLAPQRSVEFENDWASGDKSRMLRVAQAAVKDRNPAAENAVIESIMSGANPPFTTARLMRVAYDSLWRDQLRDSDVDAVLRLSLAPLYPKGLEDMPALGSLHPGVILAVAGQMPPSDPSPQLKQIQVSVFSRLPDPVGGVFRQLSELGISSAGSPEAVALAAIVSGSASAGVFDAFIGSDSSPKNVVAKLAIILPIIRNNDAATAQLVTALRDGGAEIGQVLSWFDIEELPKWSAVSGGDKLSIVLNQLPEKGLSQAQYADLLAFPLATVREQAAGALRQKFFKDADTKLLLTLSGDGNRLTRDQTIALVASLTLEPAKRGAFVEVWFGLKPDPDTVLLLLLARNSYDSSDVFNLQAARYLRRTQWKPSADVLRLLAEHPEPLARSLAYARLDPKEDAQRKILQERVSSEKDAGLLKMVTSKLSSSLPPLPAKSPGVEVRPN